MMKLKKVDVLRAENRPGQEDLLSTNRMREVPITMDKSIVSSSELYACVIQLCSDSHSIKCNIT
jgi:hypothetical protein